jgi:hypothetical protein
VGGTRDRVMKKRHHIRLLGLATVVWAAFLIGGLPDYYQQYSPVFMLVFDLLVLVPIAIVYWAVLVRLPPQRRMQVALWIAFYFTVPLAVYDFIYCGIVLGFGSGFVVDFWYLTVYYVIPWLLGPTIVWTINRRDGMNE